METAGFVIKKIISAACYPLGVSLILIMVGIAASIFTKRRRTGIVLVIVGAIVLLVFSLPVTGYRLAYSLERQNWNYCDPKDLQSRGVRNVIVLAGTNVEGSMTAADAWGASVQRTMEGIRLTRGLDGGRLVLSGGAAPGVHSDTDKMRELPMVMGLNRDEILIRAGSWDTEDEAEEFSSLVQEQPFALVTSATHLPRAVEQFEALGLDPIPCPCDFETKRELPPHLKYIPGVYGLWLSHAAVNEYLGTAWLRLKSFIR